MAAPKQRREKSPEFGRVLWIVNIAALVGLAAWIFSDAKFPLTAVQLRSALALVQGDASPLRDVGMQTGLRVPILGGVLLLAVSSLLGVFVSLFVGAAVHRRLSAWLLFTLLVAGWLTLFVAWPEFAWQGQRLRLRASLREFDAIAANLRENWPTTDGKRPGLGSFMAYPQGKPRMLMMLKSETTPAVAAVERADDGTLGFDLRGDESGAWLEWHPEGSTPRTFLGGLENNYDFSRGAPLGRGWYLVRYK
jgi:hypothetical protein